jgi:endonuclease/exonuclease/phosphatase family metal-dependent hydrolase
MIVLLLVLPAHLRAGEVSIGGKRGLKTMNVNIYVGGNIGRVMQLNPMDPAYPSNLVYTVTTVFYQIGFSQPPVRLAGVAEAIAAEMPDVVAVQEASLLRLQSPGDLALGGTIAATNVVYDYLELLLTALEARGVHYRIAAVAEQIDVEMPMQNLQTGTLDDARLTDRDAILVRADLPPGQLRVTRPQSGSFTAAIQIPALGLTVKRGWCAVDVFSRGKLFRFINAHLEEETAAPIQLAQATELLAGPAKTKLPVILCGDFNSDLQHLTGTTTCDAILAAGFKEAWAMTHPTDPSGGLTWGHDEWLADPTATFIWQLDHVFYRGPGFFAVDCEVEDLTLDRTQPPLWASDHAAMTAGFLFQRPPPVRPLSMPNHAAP